MRSLATLTLTALLLPACTVMRRHAPVSHSDAVRLQRHGLALEFMPSIDRVTFFGESGRENLLHTSDLDRSPSPDGAYTFFGGGYTWAAPQKPGTTDDTALMGWTAPGGTKRDWPPDPAMDTGPVRRTAQTSHSITFLGPQQRSGLAEVKTFEIIGRDLAELRYTLRNRGNDSASGGTWINTAAWRDDILAVRMPEGSDIYGWDNGSVERFMSICSEPDSRGWRTVGLSRAEWDGGIKVYIAAPPSGGGGTPVEIAIWRRDARAWFHRAAPALTEAQVQRLKDAGEGPVAVYIEPHHDDGAIIEAELYGPIVHLAPGEETTNIENWRVIRARSAALDVLP